MGDLVGRLDFAWEKEALTTVPLHRRKPSDIESVIFEL